MKKLFKALLIKLIAFMAELLHWDYVLVNNGVAELHDFSNLSEETKEEMFELAREMMCSPSG